MDYFELMVLFVSGFYSVKFFMSWYRAIIRVWPATRARLAQHIFGWLPLLCAAVVIVVLKSMASYDVVDNLIFILFYVLLGFAWIYAGVTLMFCFFDLSWMDDGINLNNHSAVYAIGGGIVGLTLIYAGSNIGDGPGWWCVVIAGGLGGISWFLLGGLANLCTGIFERITIERNIGAGIRFGLYLLAAGLILARACAGDWTTFNNTVIEFLDGWPVLHLTALMIIVERVYIQRARVSFDIAEPSVVSSILWGFLYVGIAVVSIILLPPLNIGTSWI